MKYVKIAKKDEIKEVRDVADTYSLQKGESWASEEEYRADQQKQLKRLFKKALTHEMGYMGGPSLKIDNYYTNTQEFWAQQKFFYDEVGLFWFWDADACRYKLVDDIDLMNALDATLGFMGQTVSAGIKRNYIEAFRRVGRQKKPKEAKKRWIQFMDTAYDLKGHTHIVDYNYFFTNPIPWKLGESSATPTIDKLFYEWVGADYVDTLYELIAYCCYRDYPIQTLFCLFGAGRNGKSCFLKMLKKFLGCENICSTDLDILVNARFESFKLYRKLACFMGETNMGTMAKSSILKRLVGGDVIGFEKKNKDPFDAENYAKVVIASNSLPCSDDNSEGFYRRWLIIDFPNQFREGKDIISTIPEAEYENLARKVTEILPGLLKRGTFKNQGSVKDREQRYLMSSNPLQIFIANCCTTGEDLFMSYSQLYTAYLSFLRFHKKRRVKTREFKAALEDQGFWVEKTSKRIGDDNDGYGIFKSGYWVTGLEIELDWKDKIKINMTNVQQSTLNFTAHEKRVEKTGQMSHSAQKCSIKGCDKPAKGKDKYSLPYCDEHWEVAL